MLFRSNRRHEPGIFLLLILVLTVSLLFLNSCSYNGSHDEFGENKLVIGVCFQGLTDEYILRLKSAFESRASELGYVFLYSDGQMNGRIQVKQVENYIRQDVDCIVINPISMTECAPAIEAAVRADIPIITLISTTTNQAKATSYVGSDSYDSGVLQAKMVIDDLSNEGEVVILFGQMGHEAQISRYAGVVDVLSESNITISAMHSGNWSRDQGYEIIASWIKAKKNFDAILAQNDAMAIGAIMALQENGLTDRVKVYGIDGQKEALEYLETGELAGTILQDATKQGTICAEIAFHAAKDMVVESEVIIPYIPLRKNSIETNQEMCIG